MSRFDSRAVGGCEGTDIFAVGVALPVEAEIDSGRRRRFGGVSDRRRVRRTRNGGENGVGAVDERAKERRSAFATLKAHRL